MVPSTRLAQKVGLIGAFRRRGCGVLVALGLTACGSGEEARFFRSSSVEKRTVIATVEASGRVRAREPEAVHAAVEGRLVEVLVRPGDKVQEGQVLARLEAEPMELERAMARAAVAAAGGAAAEAEVLYKDAAREVARVERLSARGQASQSLVASAQSARERARAALRTARANLERAKSELALASWRVEKAALAAPRDGVVLSSPTRIGETLSPKGPPLFLLSAPLEVLEVEAQVGEADIGRLTLGSRSEIEVQAYPGEVFEARIERIGVLAETQSGVARYQVRLRTPNPERRLLPGMSAAVRFEVARASDVLAVRDAALRFVPDGIDRGESRTRVFKLASRDEVRPVQVEAGISDGVFVTVRPQTDGALKPGDRVAIGYLVGGQNGAGPGLSIGGNGR